MDQYTIWIANFVSKNRVLGTCKEACEQMVSAFPELRIARGHVNDACWGKRGHFWCVTPDKRIVDPTKSQFPAPMSYDEWKPGDEVLSGKCLNCGKQLWAAVADLDRPVPRKNICNNDCERELEASFA
jgi:hypothetical protein